MPEPTTPAAAPAATPAPAAPPVTIPEPPPKLTVPASALGLDTILEPSDKNPGIKAPAATPAEPAAPAAPATPAEPAAPAAPATPAEPAAPAAPEKIKIGGKEYTVAELEKLVAKPAPAPAPKPTPAVPAPTPAAPTPEQIAAQKAETAKQEQAWVDTFVQKESINFPMSEDEMETILSGGKGAVELLGTKLAQVAARSALLARKSMYEDLDPLINNLDATLAPLLANHQTVARVSAEQQFVAAYPEFKSHLGTAREIAQALETQFPEQVRKMTQEQFAQEVAAQTDAVLQNEYKRWFPNATNTWRDAAAPPAAPVPAPAAPATPAPAPAPARVQAPAANSPAAIPVTGTPDFHKSVAKDLQD